MDAVPQILAKSTTEPEERILFYVSPELTESTVEVMEHFGYKPSVVTLPGQMKLYDGREAHVISTASQTGNAHLEYVPLALQVRHVVGLKTGTEPLFSIL